MEIFLEFLFTISFSFVLSFFIAKLLSFSSIIDQHFEIVSRSCAGITTGSEKLVLECKNGTGFLSEAVKVDAFGESVEEIDTHGESLGGSEGSRKVGTDGNGNGISSCEDTTEIELARQDEEEIEVLECGKESGRDCLREGLSDDDDDWEGIERTQLEKDFAASVCFLECKKSNADQDLKLGNGLKMQLYGLHKIATEGPCREPQPIALKLSARAKWNAWKRLGNMSPEAAMELYIALVSKTIRGWIQDDTRGDGKQDSADIKDSRKMLLNVKTIAVNSDKQ